MWGGHDTHIRKLRTRSSVFGSWISCGNMLVWWSIICLRKNQNNKHQQVSESVTDFLALIFFFCPARDSLVQIMIWLVITPISRHLGYTYWAVRKPSRYPARKNTTSSVSGVVPYPARISRTLQPVVDRVSLKYPYASPSFSNTPSFKRTVLCSGSQYTVAAVVPEKMLKWKNLILKHGYHKVRLLEWIESFKTALSTGYSKIWFNVKLKSPINATITTIKMILLRKQILKIFVWNIVCLLFYRTNCGFRYVVYYYYCTLYI